MAIPRSGLISIVVLALGVTARAVPLDALRSIVFLRSNATLCVGAQLPDHHVVTSAACDVSSFDSASFVAATSFLGDENGGFIQLTLQPPVALAVDASTQDQSLLMTTSARMWRVSAAEEAPSHVTLLPSNTSVPAALSEAATASIIEVDRQTRRVSVVDGIIYVDRRLCLEDTDLPASSDKTVCVLPRVVDDRIASQLSIPWRFLVQHGTVTDAHVLLGVGVTASPAQEADGFRSFACLAAPSPSGEDETRSSGPAVDKITGATEFVAGIRESRAGVSFCSGSLIASRFVLTAAHCAPATWVTVGATMTEGKSGEMIRVRRAVPHPDYPVNGVNPRKYDFLLLELERASSRRPVRLGSDGTAELLGKTGTLFGYGAMFTKRNSSKVLRSVNVMLGPDNAACMDSVGYPSLDTSIVCARATADLGPCSGDSGGPVVLDVGTDEQRVVTIYGGEIVSDGTCIASWAGWYLRVSAALDFIRTAMSDAKRTTRLSNAERPTQVQE